MLVQRVITALILIPLVVLGVLYLPNLVLAVVFGAIVLLAGIEWARLAQIDSIGGRTAFLTSLALCLCGLGWWHQLAPEKSWWISAVAALWWIFVLIHLIRYRPAAENVRKPWIKGFYGLLVLVPAWSSLIVIHGMEHDGPVLVLFLLVLIWVADSGAYFTGSRWGRNKLAPFISPGKSWEGVYGALVGAVVCGLVLVWYRPETGPPLMLVVFCILIAVISVVGDLFESLLKRQAAIKDSGTILPGHGGVLDRIDSLTAAAPLFLVGLSL
ncbi:MAG: phosphatidate cytidylyltransferase [Gammaproteobacteria bacterium]|nr:phosphatidate cytidylyltransferase [Gammaproteobacteria bacterium]